MNIVIESAICSAEKAGFQIIADALFDWSDGGFWMDPLGAVMWDMGHANEFRHGNFPKGWYSQLCNYIGEDEWWVHRFSMGYARKFKMMRDVSKKGEQPRWVADEVALYGIELAKRLRI